MEWAHNMFLEYKPVQGHFKDKKLIIPLEVELNFFAGLRRGIGSRFGPNQELATEWLWPLRVEMKPCQVISTQGSGKQLDVASLNDKSASLICSAQFQEKFNEVQMKLSGLYQVWIKDLQSRASDNVWYTFERIEYSFALLCAGVELRNPLIAINNHTLEITTQVKKGRPINIDHYCDNIGHELIDMHPSYIHKHPESSAKIRNALAKLNDTDFMKNYSYVGPLMGHRSFWGSQAWWPDRWMDLNYISPFIHQLTTHVAYEKLCLEHHAEYDKFKCARVYAFLKKHDDFDRIMDFDRSFFGYHDWVWTQQPLWILRNIAKVILYIGLVIHFLKIRIPQQKMIAIMCIGNIILMLPSLWMPFRRFGPDYTAYLSQASQFWAG